MGFKKLSIWSKLALFVIAITLCRFLYYAFDGVYNSWFQEFILILSMFVLIFIPNNKKVIKNK